MRFDLFFRQVRLGSGNGEEMLSGLINNELIGQKGVLSSAAQRPFAVSAHNEGADSESPKLLACLVNLAKGKIHTLSEGELSIGRSSSCDILINTDATVSRKHAIVTMIGTDFYLDDLGSRNGTVVNGELIKGTRVKLNPDDQINIGKTVYVFSPVGISEALYGSPIKNMNLENRLSLSTGALRKIFTNLFESIFNKGLKVPRLSCISGEETIQTRTTARK